METRTFARWAFIIGLVLAILLALVPDVPEVLLWVMIILGAFAGWTFIAEGETEHTFILVAIALIIVASSEVFLIALSSLASLGEPLTAVLSSLAVFFGVMVTAVVVRNIVAWLRVV